MAKKSYSFYPGCSSQKAASASNYMVSVDSMCKELDIEHNEIPDWNCCSASIGYAGGGELPRLALSARNMAISEKVNPGQDIVATCVGCQTNRPFGIDGESYENPKYLDKLVETLGAESLEKYDKKVSCCGGALAFSEPEKSQALIKDIIESAYDGGADMIVTPCPVCQMNVEVYQKHINKKYKTNFNMPVVYYSTLMSVAYGKSGKEAGLDGQMIKAKQLEAIAGK